MTGAAEQWAGPMALSTSEAFALQRGDMTLLREIQERECRFGSKFDPVTGEDGNLAACRRTVLEEAQLRVQTVWQQTNASLTASGKLVGQLRSTRGRRR